MNMNHEYGLLNCINCFPLVIVRSPALFHSVNVRKYSGFTGQLELIMARFWQSHMDCMCPCEIVKMNG